MSQDYVEWRRGLKTGKKPGLERNNSSSLLWPIWTSLQYGKKALVASDVLDACHCATWLCIRGVHCETGCWVLLAQLCAVGAVIAHAGELMGCCCVFSAAAAFSVCLGNSLFLYPVSGLWFMLLNLPDQRLKDSEMVIPISYAEQMNFPLVKLWNNKTKTISTA